MISAPGPAVPKTATVFDYDERLQSRYHDNISCVAEELKEENNGLCVEISSTMGDEEEQQDELVALEAIYGKTVFTRSLEEPGGEVRLHVDMEQPCNLSFESAGGRKELSDKIPEMEVKYLPPVVLNFSYPTNYPSSDPPMFALSCKWLNEMQVRGRKLLQIPFPK